MVSYLWNETPAYHNCTLLKFYKYDFNLKKNCYENTAIDTMYLQQRLMEKQQDSEMMCQQRCDKLRGELVQTAALIKITSVSDGLAKEQRKCVLSKKKKKKNSPVRELLLPRLAYLFGILSWYRSTVWYDWDGWPTETQLTRLLMLLCCIGKQRAALLVRQKVHLFSLSIKIPDRQTQTSCGTAVKNVLLFRVKLHDGDNSSYTWTTAIPTAPIREQHLTLSNEWLLDL